MFLFFHESFFDYELFHKMKPVFVHVFFMLFPEYFSVEILSHYEEQDFSKVILLKGPDLGGLTIDGVSVTLWGQNRH